MSVETDHRPSPLGRILRTGPQGVLVVESDGEPVDPGTRCLLEDGRPAGVVRLGIGPVDGPMLVVDPSRGPAPDDGRPDTTELVGSTLYPR